MWRMCILVLAGVISMTLISAADPQTKPVPKPEAIAETRLLMEGLALANFRGLERLLKDKPPSIEAWTFARGQSLLIAEAGNLLMLRPPRGQAQVLWLDRAADLRTAATRLARTMADQDHDRARTAFTELAKCCNRCHQAFRVELRLTPFGETADRNAQPPVP
jgi:hypothetical protein